MIECNDLFDYGYKIYQNPDYFKFSLDSILLAEFIKFKPNDNILDMCTGNSPIPLILISKSKKIRVDAVEIQKEVYDLATESIKINNCTDYIKIYNEDINKYTPLKKYDIVVTNPPYFKVSENGYQTQNEVKRCARHEITVNLEQIINAAKNNLKENGTFYMVHRVERYLETIELLKKYKLGIRKTCFIYTKDDTPAEFFLIEASKCKKDDLKVTYKNIKDLKSYKNIFKED